MDWKKVFSKGFKGLVTTVVALLVAQAEPLIALIVGFIPEQYATMTIAGIVASVITAASNWLKHRND